MVDVAVEVGILDVPPLQPNLVYAFARVPGLVDHCSAEDVFDFTADEGASLTGLYMLKVGHLKQLPAYIEHHAITEIRSCCHFFLVYLNQFCRII